ncbi:TetR family transcriptional regulator [Phenylobacterium sp. LjRoot225]|uniref:TetR family transcriptional regulator n=1 Tax=Phenylobacterium sp. LjRoot225 TaxID=3342285 RepID=UPI003ECE95A4
MSDETLEAGLRGARTTAAIRRAIQESPDSIRTLAERYGVNPKTIAKWRSRASVEDRKTGPQNPKSTVLTLEQEAIIVAFRRYSFLPLDDCFYALGSFIPQLTRSSLHRCLRRHGVSRLQGGEGAPSEAGCFDLHLLTPEREGGFNLFLAVDRASKFAFGDLHAQPTPAAAAETLRALVAAAPNRVHAVVVEAETPFAQGQEFGEACAAAGVELRTAEARWTPVQIELMTRTMQAAARRRAAGDRDAHLRQLAQVMQAYNGRCRLKTLGGLTPSAHLARMSMEADPLACAAATPRNPPAARARGAAVRRGRDPANTREVILRAARSCLAKDGPEGLSLSEVARVAGVSRGAAYQHFETREKLVTATAEWVSDKLFRAVFGDSARERSLDQVDIAGITDRLANYAMDNPELCRAWLLQVLSSPDPAADSFWREYAGSQARFARTELSQADLDAEVQSVIMLAGAFLWPVWARSQSTAPEDLRRFARRFSQECLRISMYGKLKSERYPEIAARLKREAANSA